VSLSPRERCVEIDIPFNATLIQDGGTWLERKAEVLSYELDATHIFEGPTRSLNGTATPSFRGVRWRRISARRDFAEWR
jgi:hypothetical protein